MLSKDSNLETVPNTAKIFKMHPQVLYRMIADGRLPAYRIGTAVRLDLNELEKTLKKEGSNAHEG